MKFAMILGILPLFALSFKDKLLAGSPGDFMVYKQQRTYNVFVINDVTARSITIEEISVPSHKESTTTWRAWLEEGAPGCTGWLRYRIDVEKGSVEEVYSVTRQCWLPPEGNDPLLATMLREQLVEIPHKQRKKMAAKPGSLEQPIWTPPLVVDGASKAVKALAYSLYWPSDQSAIAGQPLDLYFSEESPFPYWIELTARNLRFRGIDSGKGLTIKNPAEAPKPLHIVKVTKNGDEVTFEMNNPSLLDEIGVYLTVNKQGKLETLPCTIISKKQEREQLLLIATLPAAQGEVTILPENHPALATSHHIH